MSQLSAKARALCAGAAVALAAVLAAVLIGLVADRGTSRTQAERPPRPVGGIITLRIPGAGHLLVSLPKGWGITRMTPGTLALASPGTCHTATLAAFVDRTKEPPPARAEHLLGYVVGRDFDGGRLWRGTTAGGHGYAVYDPPSLVGVEALRRSGQSLAVVVHGLPTHAHCSAHAAAAPRWELSLLLQNLRVLEPPLPGPQAAPHETA